MTNASNQSSLVYHLTVNDVNKLDYHFSQNELGLKLVESVNLATENWMALEHMQCRNCPLNKRQHPFCPIAKNLGVLLKDWHNIVSFDKVSLEVISKNRTISATTTAQSALSSLLGLIMATSDCPHTQFFRPMAYFHLPLSTPEETSFRAISTHLMTQFFRLRNGEAVQFNLQGLIDIYETMHTVNIFMKRRIESAVVNDAALNAVVLLDLLAITLPNYLDVELERLEKLF
ncbi:MAG TPA: hypothetical protein ENK06_14630 [Gammaproteobacteria bacterium]|nr:hypothetical protein [Gammaproteobacteria bacterium]